MNLFKQFFRLRRVLNQIPITESTIDEQFYLIFTIRQFPFILNQELFIANILARNGAKVVVVLDNGLFEHWDTKQVRDSTALNSLNPSRTSKFKTFFTRAYYTFLYRHPNIKVNLINNANLVAEPHADRDFYAKFALDSTKRFFMKGSYNSNIMAERNYYELSLKNSEKSYRIARHYYECSEGVNAVIMSHGIYSTWGPMYSYFKDRGVPTYVYGANVYTSSRIFVTDTLTQTLNKDTDLQRYQLEQPLNIPKQIRLKVDEVLSVRLNLKSKDNKFYYGENKVVEQKLSKRPGDVYFGMFPNVVWDGDIAERSRLFESIQDWVLKTIEFFLKAPKNHKLVIKLHPGETTIWSGSHRLIDVISLKFPGIDSSDQIIIIDSVVKIHTYKFVSEYIDYGIVYDGIMALELYYLNIPVIAVSDGRYTNKKFLIEPENISEYVALLSNIERLKEAAHISLKYGDDFVWFSYWFFYKSSYYLPIFSEKRFGEIDIKNNLCEAEKQELKRTTIKLCSL